MRIFIAIDLTTGIKTELARAVRLLKPVAAGIKWVEPENYHLTLKFLGEVSESQVEVIKAVLEDVVSRHCSFQLTVKSTGSFPPGQSRMRVIWVGLEAEPELLALQSDLEDCLGQSGFEREERPFSPHLTIGRAREPQRQDRLKAELEKLGSKEFGAMKVNEISLFESRLRPEGPEYKIISRHQLK
ncbi:MAG: RNA 2',3'-cyclic phosphodiesterase [Candidatus Saccharicenans sp.]|uniref:RNA 2',3'-cyclic phosphodiesterase n=1 Tax=Candidatus Saccharicenans sp. TaxID=2819258 RepID=UPI00404B1006